MPFVWTPLWRIARVKGLGAELGGESLLEFVLFWVSWFDQYKHTSLSLVKH